ncbi:MAG: hypothetical protein H0U28_07080 [Nocardioidaceae bacterium]|nr:hypothetical protein [Nocardioidaceae bacterium]
MRRHAFVAALLAVATAAGTQLPTGTANAAKSSLNVTSIRVHNLIVVGGSCRNIDITARHNGPTHNDFDMDLDIDVWRGRKYVGSAYVYDDRPGRVVGDYFWCPFLDGLGKFRAGPSEVDWYNWGRRYSSGSFRDGTRDSFWVKQGSRTKVFVDRTRHRVTFTPRAQYYSVNRSRWRSWEGHRVVIERRLATGQWKRVARTRAGHATTVFSPKRHAWRAVTLASSNTARSRSGVERI